MTSVALLLGFTSVALLQLSVLQHFPLHDFQLYCLDNLSQASFTLGQ